MCGIIGIFNKTDAQQQAELGLAVLKNRGKDASRMVEVQNGVIGHTLHAIVNHVTQPIQKVGILTANCEIYNWKKLNQKYEFSANNDAELLLLFLDKFGLEKLSELDGVFAFAYIKDGRLYLVRDLLGVKPVCYVYNEDGFAFASEKKVLEKLGYLDVQELNPRNILTYNIAENKVEFKQREFFNYLPEHQASYSELKDKSKNLLDRAIQKRIPAKKFGLLFSGGIDSTYLAKYFMEKGYEFTCYTAALETDNKEPTDLTYSKKVAEELGLKLKIKTIKQSEIPSYLEKIVPLIEDSNVVKVGVALTFYLACELAREDGCRVIFSGLGSEEIFAGYERHKLSANINQECVAGLRKIYERDLYRDDVLTMDNNLELRLPYLDFNLVSYALKIPEIYKIKEGITKYILRDFSNLPKEFAFRKKTAAQYGSKLDYALGKLAKLENKSKSEYLREFYPTHNVKLGVLFSSGKDSMSAAYIMHKQNYQLSCLITMKSKNPDSYMFQSAGTELVEMQAEAIGLPIVVEETKGIKEDELKDLSRAIKRAKEEYKIEGIVSGALFSTYQRDRIENICDKLGLKIFSPLWHKPQEIHMLEVITNKFEVLITAIAADGLDESFLGRKIDHKLLDDFKGKLHLNVAGEGGEFESLVLNGPLFKKRIELVTARKEMDSKHSGRLIIEEAKLLDK